MQQFQRRQIVTNNFTGQIIYKNLIIQYDLLGNTSSGDRTHYYLVVFGNQKYAGGLSALGQTGGTCFGGEVTFQCEELFGQKLLKAFCSGPQGGFPNISYYMACFLDIGLMLYEYYFKYFLNLIFIEYVYYF